MARFVSEIPLRHTRPNDKESDLRELSDGGRNDLIVLTRHIRNVMLIRLEPPLLQDPIHKGLLDFLRRPFADESCRRVEQELPIVASAYRALASTKPDWESFILPSPIDDPASAFVPALRKGMVDLPGMHEVLLRTQIQLLHEDLVDHQERASIRSGRALAEGGSTAHAALALQAFSLHEATFLTLACIFQARKIDSLIEFSLTSLGRDCLRNRVRTTTMQAFTDASTRHALQAVVQDARSRASPRSERISDVLRPEQLDVLEGRFLDTYFSLSSRMQQDAAVALLIGRARELCRWMALLELVRLSGDQGLEPDSATLERLGLNPALPDAIFAARSNAISSDRGIYRTSSGAWTLGGSAVGHAINCCKAHVLSSMEARELGAHFQAHAKSYIEEHVPSEDYVVRQGFKAAASDTKANYDCDLILLEPRRHKIFFVQMKWKRNSRTANLDDELTAWRASNSPLTHGISQLRGLRERLSEKRVLNQIKGQLKDFRLTDQQILENASFIVVHTLPYFSAYLSEGVAIYEWNLFRNLLLRGATRRAQADLEQFAAVSHHAPLPLEEPERALDYFYQVIGVDLESLPAAMDARMEAKYEFGVKLRAPKWWEWRSRRGVLSVARPYL